MKVLSIKVDEALFKRLRLRAYGANLTISQFVRPLLEEAAVPGNRYVHSSQDELLSVAIQSFAMVSALTAEIAPRAIERGIADARSLLRDRGLLDPARDPYAVSDAGAEGVA